MVQGKILVSSATKYKGITHYKTDILVVTGLLSNERR
jgi:hypothetical protein